MWRPTRKLEQETIEIRRMLIAFSENYSRTAPPKVSPHSRLLLTAHCSNSRPSSAGAGGMVAMTAATYDAALYDLLVVGVRSAGKVKPESRPQDDDADHRAG